MNQYKCHDCGWVHAVIQSAIDDVLKALPGAALLPEAGVIVCSSLSKPFQAMP